MKIDEFVKNCKQNCKAIRDTIITSKTGSSYHVCLSCAHTWRNNK